MYAGLSRPRRSARVDPCRPTSPRPWALDRAPGRPAADSGGLSRVQAGFSCPDALTRPAHAAGGVGAADVDALVAGLGRAVEGALERGGQLRVDPAEQVARCQVALVARTLPEGVARDRVAGCDRRVDRVRG